MHDAKLLAGMAGITYANAAEIIRHTATGWSESDQEEFERMLRVVFYSVETTSCVITRTVYNDLGEVELRTDQFASTDPNTTGKFVMASQTL